MGKIHSNKASNNQDIRYPCEKCPKVFLTLSRKNAHLKFVHDKIKDYKCNTCGKSFKCSRDLNGHIETVHENIKRFECKICDKHFTQVSGLYKHVRSVHNELKYSLNLYFAETNLKYFCQHYR